MEKKMENDLETGVLQEFTRNTYQGKIFRGL